MNVGYVYILWWFWSKLFIYLCRFEDFCKVFVKKLKDERKLNVDIGELEE